MTSSTQNYPPKMTHHLFNFFFCPGVSNDHFHCTLHLLGDLIFIDFYSELSNFHFALGKYTEKYKRVIIQLLKCNA